MKEGWKIRKAVIPAAGLGTRFLPASKTVPKELLPIVDIPTIQFIVEEAVAAGVEEVILVTSRGKGAIEDYFDVSYELEDKLRKKGKDKILKEIQRISSMIRLVSVRQKEPRGLGHAVWCAKEAVGDEPFLVILGDDIVDAETPCCRQMMEVNKKHGGAVVALMEVEREEIGLYGIIDGERVDDRVIKIKSVVEKPSVEEATSNLAIIGRYILPPGIFSILEKTPPAKGGEIQLTDAIATLAKTGDVFGYTFDGVRFDAGDKLGFIKANISFALKHPDIGEGVREYINKIVLER